MADRRAFESDLFASYKAAGLPIRRIPMGRAILESEAKKRAHRLPKKIADSLSVLDDLMLDAIVWFHSVAMTIWNERPPLDQHFSRAIMALAMRVAQDAMVIRNLIQGGFDVQARNLLRFTGVIFVMPVRL